MGKDTSGNEVFCTKCGSETKFVIDDGTFVTGEEVCFYECTSCGNEDHENG